MWFNNLNNCLKMVLVCLILKPRGWDYFLETWTLLQPSICIPGWIPVHLLSAFGMCQFAEPTCRIPMPKLLGLHLTHAGEGGQLEQRYSAAAVLVRPQNGTSEQSYVETTSSFSYPAEWTPSLELLRTGEALSFTMAEGQTEIGYSVGRCSDTCIHWPLCLA